MSEWYVVPIEQMLVGIPECETNDRNAKVIASKESNHTKRQTNLEEP